MKLGKNKKNSIKEIEIFNNKVELSLRNQKKEKQLLMKQNKIISDRVQERFNIIQNR